MAIAKGINATSKKAITSFLVKPILRTKFPNERVWLAITTSLSKQSCKPNIGN
jgi:hypothetical protein